MRASKIWMATMIVGAALLAAGAGAQSPASLPGRALPSAVSPMQKLPVQSLPAVLRQKAPTKPVPGFQPKATASTALTMVGTRGEFQPKSTMAAGLAMVGTRAEFQPRSTMAAGMTMVGTR